ncbi:unannotated protein [freshwater metagenome]|uniref:Unannotated protein n=1 Tax=freshwater metagenome TaxID=449393 RepID=A0A6J7H9B2_9ZZZZ|nr:CoA transferase [Actinomycetota bacterium]
MSLPLEGVRVLDMSRLLPGPFCSLLLADFGADVLKIEDMGIGDYARWAPPFHEGVEGGAGAAIFVGLNRNKRSLRVNLKAPEGKEIFLKLVAGADVVLDSFRPGVLERLGVGYEQMRAANPGIIHCAITGYGLDGPLRDRSGHDLNYLARIGLLGLGGDDGAPLVQSAAQIADIGGGGLMAAFGIMAALRERERSGEGQVVDISMADGALSWLTMLAANTLADGSVPRRGDLALGGGFLCYRPYPCADGHVALGALEPKFFQNFLAGVGREELAEHQFEGPGTPAHAELEAIFAARTRAEWAAFAEQHDCCLEPVLALDEALDSELVREREMVVEIAQPGAAAPVRTLGNPVKLSRTPGDVHRLHAPQLGEHTQDALRDAGYGEEEIAALLEQGVVGLPPEEQLGSFLT